MMSISNGSAFRVKMNVSTIIPIGIHSYITIIHFGNPNLSRNNNKNELTLFFVSLQVVLSIPHHPVVDNFQHIFPWNMAIHMFLCSTMTI